MEELYRQFGARGFVVLAFPCNQFGGQDPGSDTEIESLCRLTYDVTFPVLAKIEVNGPAASPLYRYLKQQKGGLLGRDIKWNFTKFLVDRSGAVVDRFAPQTTPEQIRPRIETLLRRSSG